MSGLTWHTVFRTPDETGEFAARVGQVLEPGDTILLSGDIGAGKTHFARHLIQALLNEPEDVPSPTFTLIQVYETRKGSLQHADLYRVSGPDDIVELGLFDAFATDICLVEWPDRLGEETPQNALSISLTSGEDLDARHAKFVCKNAEFAARLKDVCDA